MDDVRINAMLKKKMKMFNKAEIVEIQGEIWEFWILADGKCEGLKIHGMKGNERY